VIAGRAGLGYRGQATREMAFPTALRALQHRDFRRFWLGQVVSLVGRWMQSVAQSWLVLELTGSPLKLGIVNSLQFAPLLFLALPAGVVVDRFPKRWLLVISQAGLMVPALVLAALSWTGHVQFWHVAVLAGVMGLANALDMPTRQSMMVELVGRDDLMNAIALNSGVFNAARIVGPALGGVLIARYGVALAFVVNGVTYLPVIAALLAMRPAGPVRASRRGRLGAEIADGLRYARRTPLIALVLGLVCAISVFTVNHNVTVPLLARDVLGEEVRGFGFLMAAVGVGAVAGAVLLAQFGRGRPPVGGLIGGGLALSAGILGLSAVREFWLAAGVLFVVGLVQILLLSSCNTTLQVTVPDELRGRVMSLYTFVFAGVSPFGAFFIGSIAEALGPPAAFAAGGGLGLVCVLALGLRWARREADTGPVPAER
jgi:MFS family permease